MKKLPISELKIDRAFVNDMSTNKEDRIIVDTTLAIAKELGLRTVGEGIEDETTLDMLKDSGCHLGQGFYIKRPSPDQDLLLWLLADNQYKVKKTTPQNGDAFKK